MTGGQKFPQKDCPDEKFSARRDIQRNFEKKVMKLGKILIEHWIFRINRCIRGGGAADFRVLFKMEIQLAICLRPNTY